MQVRIVASPSRAGASAPAGEGRRRSEGEAAKAGKGGAALDRTPGRAAGAAARRGQPRTALMHGMTRDLGAVRSLEHSHKSSA